MLKKLRIFLTGCIRTLFGYATGGQKWGPGGLIDPMGAEDVKCLGVEN